MHHTDGRNTLNDDHDIEAQMDLEGRLRFHAEALLQAPSGVVVPGTCYAEGWQEGDESRGEVLRMACSVLENVPADEIGEELADRMRFEASAMLAASEGGHVPGTFHLINWNDKPHRLIYDAARLMIEAADAIAAKTKTRA